MAAAPAVPAVPEEHIPDGEEEDEYESDEYDVEDDEADADYQGDDADEEEDDEGDEDGEEGGENLTALLVADPNQRAQADEEDDEGYAPPGETDPADKPIDGNARLPVGDISEANSTTTPSVVATGLKRKTSGDEDDEEEGDEDESDAKKLRA